MIKVKHTLGPWEVREIEEPKNRFEYYIHSEGYGVVGYWQYPEKEENAKWVLTKEDANLISAAPELLQALEKALQEEESYEFGLRVFGEWKEEARNAIAKAMGESK